MAVGLVGTGVGHVGADDEIPVPSLAHRIPELALVPRLHLIAGRGAGHGRVGLAPVEVHSRRVEVAEHLVRLPHPGIAGLEGVGAPAPADEVRGIGVEAPALVSVEDRLQVAGHVGKVSGIDARRGEGLPGQIPAVRVDGRLVDVTDTGRTAAVLVVQEEVAVATAHDQLRRRSPVASERVERQRIDRAEVRTERARIGRRPGVPLAIGAVRVPELPHAPRVRVVPPAEQAQRVEHPVVQPVVRVVLRESLGQLARTGVVAGEGRRAANRVERRHIAREQPQAVVDKRPADLVARLQDVARVFLRHVVLGCAVPSGGARGLRKSRVQAQTADRAEACEGAGATGGVTAGTGVQGVQRIRAEIRLQLAVPRVRAVLRNGVDDATQGATVLGLEARALDLDFLKEVYLKVLAHTAVHDVRGVYAVDEVDVFRVAGAVDLEAVVAAPAAALQRFLTRARSKCDQRLERAALGYAVDDVEVHRDRHLRLGDVHDRSLAGDHHCLLHLSEFQDDVYGGQTAGRKSDAGLPVGAETLHIHRQGVFPGRQLG